MPLELGYCTNVHAGPDLESTKANLENHALRVKESFSPDGPMGIGLWLAAPAAASLQDGPALEEFRDWLNEHGLHPFTLNGFPYGNFHQEVVKHDVYHPTWMDDKRLTYTLHLVHALDQLLSPGSEGSISTLPIAWGSPRPSPEMLDHAADNLITVARQLAELEDRSGRLIYLCLEPEPGCALERSRDILGFFRDHLLTRGEEHQVLRYLRVCHDVCHSAVMFEEQAEVLAGFAEAGIRVGKVQISSAVEARFQELAPENRALALDQLVGFAEHRYLHQTST
ncbi:MAG: metabolite traffic protein EboE, partial [Pirellulaceae bacterium]